MGAIGAVLSEIGVAVAEWHWQWLWLVAGSVAVAGWPVVFIVAGERMTLENDTISAHY
jgi:hypothetical protein